MLTEVRDLLIAGGWVSVPLVLVSTAMWFVAVLRLSSLRRGFSGAVAQRVANVLGGIDDPAPRGPVDRYLAAALRALGREGTCQHDLSRFLKTQRETVTDYGLLLMGLVTVAPLLGLLGTVSGMIETFASMHGVEMTHATEQTVAGGISVALISTQLGLVIGVPGLAVARLLKRMEDRRSRELAQAHSLLIQARKVPP